MTLAVAEALNTNKPNQIILVYEGMCRLELSFLWNGIYF